MAGGRPDAKQVQFGPELCAAVEAEAAKRHWTFATLVRVATAEFVRQPQLASMVKQGRPVAEPSPKPAAKRSRKKLPK